MTEGPWDPITACLRTPHARLRASDADRERAIDTLANAFGQGRLTKDEFSARAGEALASRTYGDLAAITFSIPPRPSDAPAPRTARAQRLDRTDRKTLVWAMFLLLMPATLGTGFVTHYIWFFVMFVAAFVGVAVTAQPDT